MIPQLPIQAILNVTDGRYGLRYLKIVKSPNGPHYIVDVMFKKGLRLTADVLPGRPAKNIGVELTDKLRAYRPGEFDQIYPAVAFVSDCAARALSDESGIVVERQLHADLMKEAWEMTLFRRLLRTIDPKSVLDYERIQLELESIFRTDTTESGGVPVDQ